jgi:hypothetical protein
MNSRLPRELRDMIYAYLWDEMTASDAMSSIWKGHLAPMDGISRCCGVFHGDRPHFINSELVGPHVPKEVVAAWYKAAQEVADHPFKALSPYDIEAFVTIDHFNLGINPATVLRRMDLEFDLEDFVMVCDPADGLDPVLDHLLRIQNKRGFILRVKLKQKRIRLNQWPIAVDISKPILQEFIAQGAQVRIYWTYDGDVPEAVERDLAPLLAQPPADWKTDVIKFLDDVSDPTQTCPYIADRFVPLRRSISMTGTDSTRTKTRQISILTTTRALYHQTRMNSNPITQTIIMT